MVNPYQLLIGVIALCLVVLAPVGLVLVSEIGVRGWRRTVADLRERWREIGRHRDDLEAMRVNTGIPLEQLAADLRRLRHEIETDQHRSAAHQLGTRLAYDKVLVEVCAMLHIEHDLASDELKGLDRDIERIRVEADLERAGVRLSDRRFGQAA